MTIGNAKKFITRALTDQKLRDQLNKATTLPKLYQALDDQELSFSAPEFEEAFRNRLTSCQMEDQAEQLKELKMWWDMLHHFFGCTDNGLSASCTTSSSCAASGSCSGHCG